MRRKKCDKCHKRQKYLFGWFGFWLCNPCIFETVKEMREKGVLK